MYENNTVMGAKLLFSITDYCFWHPLYSTVGNSVPKFWILSLEKSIGRQNLPKMKGLGGWRGVKGIAGKKEVNKNYPTILS